MTAPAITRPAAGTRYAIPTDPDRGVPGYADRCAIALAIFAAIPDVAQVDVYRDPDDRRFPVHANVVMDNHTSMLLGLGYDARDFICLFDVLAAVEPATFTAEVIA